MHPHIVIILPSCFFYHESFTLFRLVILRWTYEVSLRLQEAATPRQLICLLADEAIINVVKLHCSAMLSVLVTLLSRFPLVLTDLSHTHSPQ